MTPAVAALLASAPQGEPPRDARADFETLHVGPWRGVAHRSFAPLIGPLPVLLEEILAQPGDVLRSGGGQGVTARRAIGGFRTFCKVYRAENLHRRVRDMLGISRALGEWEACLAATGAGISVARILFAGTKREGLGARHLVVTEELPGIAANRIAQALGPDAAARAAFEDELRAIVARFHAAGFWHAHLHAKHVFIARDGTPMVIDLERSRVAPPLPRKARERNFAQMERSLRKLRESGIGDRESGKGG